jgi:hypothetical protein
MADEITLNVRLQLANGTLTYDFRPGTIQIDQTTAGMSSQVLSIGTAEEDISFGDVGTVGACALYNLDATNYVQFGKKDGSGNMQAIGRLDPAGMPSVFKMDSGATLRMAANTAACKVLVVMFEE